MNEFINKLIERLEEESRNAQDNMVKSTSNSMANFCSGACGAYNKTIEIVNQLAEEYNNDFCEWRLCDEEANVYDTTCMNPHILLEGSPSDNNYKFCPYCGKKIKVVE